MLRVRFYLIGEIKFGVENAIMVFRLIGTIWLWLKKPLAQAIKLWTG